MKAYAWFTLAVAGAFRSEVAKKKAERDQLGSTMTSEQISEAQDLAAELRELIESSKSE